MAARHRVEILILLELPVVIILAEVTVAMVALVRGLQVAVVVAAAGLAQ
jgi:hypothetical protein